MNYGYSNPLDEIKRFFRQGSVLSILIIINLAVWVLVKIIQVIFFLFNQPDSAIAQSWITHYFALPAFLPALLSKPWTIFSYMILHIDFWHILFNMLWLYWFGKIFMEYLSSRQLFFTYLFGGISGGLLYVLAFNIFPVFHNILPRSVALGASASVMAIVMAISFYVPNYSIHLIFIGRIKIIYLAIALFVLDFFAIPAGNSGGHIAHIGGAVWGFIYILFLRKNLAKSYSGFSSNNFSWIGKLFSFLGSGKKSYSNYSQRPKTDDEYNMEKAAKQKKIDHILEKISKGGYESLTKEEKDFLFRSSGKNP
jgi:membrane associated rhomboid family serine protease